MNNLNLIPPAYKDRLRVQRVYLLIKKMLMLIILYTIFLGIVLLVARFILVNNFIRITDETTLVTKVNREIERRINDLNKEIATAKIIQNKTVPWAEFLVSFAKLVPDGVVINSMTLASEKNNRSIITGVAQTRDSLLSFENKLNQAPFIANIDLPFKYKQDKNNSLFTVTITVKFDKIPLF